MSEKRSFIRSKQRIKLKFGLTGPDHLAYTDDVSLSGLFIKTAHVLSAGQTIHIELHPPDMNTIHLEGRIIWGKKVPPQLLNLVKKSGMGVLVTRIVSGEQEFTDLCRCLGRNPVP